MLESDCKILVVFNVFLTVHHDIHLFQLPTQCTILLLYNTYITVLYIFQAILCSSSGDQMFSLNLCTERPLTESDDTKCYINTI
jgi:hypothetical protein